MLFTDTIRAKRDGGTLSEAQIQQFVDGLADESLPAEQVSALAMAVFLNGMSFDEAATLTAAMANSGTVLDWAEEGLAGPIVDKHSTGGVGDKVSFLLAPIAAACGCFVPMISGRGLGHTGGTTDKVESIPGYQSTPDFDLFRKVVREVGCSIIGQTVALAPADRRFYSIRDITSTVESIPLITASILSKKIAAGLEGLVMDVKTGNGAFMDSEDKARSLANSIIKTAAASGLKSRAVLTDMNEVLGYTAGNALEIAECVRFLTNQARHPALEEVTFALVAEMLLIGGIETERTAALARIHSVVANGEAAERFGKMVGAMGGPNDFIERWQDYLVAAPEIREIRVEGYLAAVDTRAVGNAIIELGGGRRTLGDTLDLSVGFADFADIGDRLGDHKPLATIHAANPDDAKRATVLLKEACSVSDSPVSKGPVILDVLS